MKKQAIYTTINSREDLERAQGDYNSHYFELERLKNALDREITELKKKYEAPIAAATEAGDAVFENIQAWAALHPDEFPKGKKSIELLHGTVGFRTNPPAVKTIKGVTIAYATAEVEKNGYANWIRHAVELDRQAILADYAAHSIDESELTKNGLRIVQDETFYIDPKRENKGE